MTLAIAALAVLCGAALQSATGFGFALATAPVLFALLGPHEAVTGGSILSVELGILTLATERRVPQVLRREALALMAWSLPGLATGAVALRELPDRVLSVLVAIGVMGALGLRLRGRWSGPLGGAAAQTGAAHDDGRRATRAIRPARGWHTALAGLTSGALSTAASLTGPPLVLHLVARGLSPDQMRDTLSTLFVALAALTIGALVLADTFDMPSGFVVLLVAGIAGQVIGRRAFARLAGGRHEDALLVVLACTAVVALVSSIV